METKRFEATLRTEKGKNAVKKLRAQRQIPATVYGHKTDPVSITVDRKGLLKLYKSDAGQNILLTLEIKDGDKKTEENVISYEVVRDAISQEIEHVDFLKVIPKVPIKVIVPVRLEGVAPGTKMGGVLVQKLHELKISVLPSQIPSQITIDITSMMIGDFIQIKDVDTQGQYEILQSADDTIVRLAAPRTATELAELDEDVDAGVEGEAAAEGRDAPAEGGEEAAE